MTEVAAVSQESYPLQWAGRQAVMTLPEHLSVSNAARIREELLSAISRGTTVLIADMTATLSCDHDGAAAVASVYQRALRNGTQLCLVVTAPAVLHVLRINGLDQLIPIYPSLDAAFAAAMTGSSVTVPSPKGSAASRCGGSSPCSSSPRWPGGSTASRPGRSRDRTPTSWIRRRHLPPGAADNAPG